MKNIDNIDKSKLVLVYDEGDRITDQPLESKEIGYYKDSWNRFKKNRASLVAFIIICIFLVFIIFGPHIKVYNLPNTNPIEATRIGYLPPKIPVLEKMGIATGKNKITKGKRFLTHMYHSEFGKDVIISGFPQELAEDPNHPDFAAVPSLTVTVDMYKYINYIKSYMPESYYGDLDNNEKGGSYVDPLGSVRRTLNETEFNDYLSKNYIIDILSVIETVNEETGQRYISYEVRINQFLASLNQTPDDTYFWFGTTREGKDLFTEIWRGGRISLLMALSVLLINTAVGLTIGSIVGYYGGVLDLIFDRIVEIISSVPFLVVLTLLTLRYGSALWVIVIAFTATGWIGAYGTGRMQFYRFKNREYVLAARTLGASDARIMFKHIFPNTLGYIVTGYALAIPGFIFTEASYSFLGIINYANTTSIGMLLKQGQETMHVYPHLLLFPSIYIAILMIAFNLFGNGLRDAFNPSLRGAE